MRTLTDYTGMKLGKITVTGRAPTSESGKTQWFVDCECGQHGVVMSANKIAGGQHHCGCGFNAKSKNISAAYKRRQEKALKPAVLKSADRVINEFLYQYRREYYAYLRTDQWSGPLPEARYCQIPQTSPSERLEVYLRGLR
jgi:hypothetical protein